MKIVCHSDGRIGVLHDGAFHDATGVLKGLDGFGYPLPSHDVFIAALNQLRPALEELIGSGNGEPIGGARFRAPVANPGKIVAAPVNYLKHLAEAREDRGIHHENQVGEIQRVGLFLKATSSLIGQDRAVALRFPDRRNDHEIELVAVIGKTADRVAAKDALEYVAGYSIGLDMTVRGPEERSMRKSIDTYSVLGPHLVTADEFGDPTNVDLELTVNGEVRQKANTRDLVLSVAELIEYASRYYTLHPGDLLYTGTPEGVGPVAPGDTVRAKIERIGTLEVAITSS